MPRSDHFLANYDLVKVSSLETTLSRFHAFLTLGATSGSILHTVLTTVLPKMPMDKIHRHLVWTIFAEWQIHSEIFWVLPSTASCTARCILVGEVGRGINRGSGGPGRYPCRSVGGRGGTSGLRSSMGHEPAACLQGTDPRVLSAVAVSSQRRWSPNDRDEAGHDDDDDGGEARMSCEPRFGKSCQLRLEIAWKRAAAKTLWPVLL